jgi:outer membrane protein OmpA-like peptidoglycan-associated protein
LRPRIKLELRMQNRNRVVIVCAALALTFSLNSCAWLSNTMSRAKERIVAMRERMKASKPAEEAAAVAAPAQVTAAGAAVDGTGHGHHVIAGTGKPIGNGAGECVNAGFDAGTGHAGGCGNAANVAASEPAPVVEATPMREQPVVSGAEVPVAERAIATEPAPAASSAAVAAAQPAEELFPPATEAPAAAPAPPAQPPKPAVSAAAPPAPPVVEQAMPKPPAPVEKISLSADALFPFAKHNEASMLPTGKAKLQALAERIKAVGSGALSGVAITGHADRLGRQERNQRLSERRALTVKNYLAKLGVDPALMSANGKGENDPVVFCNGNKRTAKLKSCLAPNRRVDVAFFGDSDKIAHSR